MPEVVWNNNPRNADCEGIGGQHSTLFPPHSPGKLECRRHRPHAPATVEWFRMCQRMPIFRTVSNAPTVARGKIQHLSGPPSRVQPWVASPPLPHRCRRPIAPHKTSLASYHSESEDDLRQLPHLEALSQAAIPEMPLAKALRLRGGRHRRGSERQTSTPCKNLPDPSPRPRPETQGAIEDFPFRIR
jgi:hypothetical protein